MRHRAARPVIDLWRRLPRTVARPLNAVARLRPVRAVAALLLVLGVGTGAFVAVAAVGGSSSNPPAERAAPSQRPEATTSRAGERPDLTPTGSSSGSPTSAAGRSRESATPPATRSPSPSPSSILPSTPGSDLPQAPVPAVGTTAAPSPSGSGQDTPTGSSAPRDRTPPTTSLSEDAAHGDSATFSFRASEPASFTCSLDGAAYVACDSPRSYSGLTPGWHIFAVRATDAAGNVDPSPAQARWHATGGPSTDR